MILKNFCVVTVATALLYAGAAGVFPGKAQARVLDVLKTSPTVQKAVAEAAHRVGSSPDSCHWTLMVEPNQARVQCFGAAIPPALPGDEEYPNCDVAIYYQSGADNSAVRVDQVQVICNQYVGCLQLDVNMNCGERAGTR